MDFSKAETTHKLSVLFGEQGTISILEAFDVERIDQELPFLGAIVVVYGGNEIWLVLPKDLTKYLELNFTLRKKIDLTVLDRRETFETF